MTEKSELINEQKAKELFIKSALELHDMTEAQVYAANEILLQLKKSYQYPDSVRDHKIIKKVKEEYECEVHRDDIAYVLKKLENDFYFIDKEDGNDQYKIRTEGLSILNKHKDFVYYLGANINDTLVKSVEIMQEKAEQKELNRLQKKELKLSIFQIKYSILFIIGNAILTIIISVIVVFILKKLGLT